MSPSCPGELLVRHCGITLRLLPLPGEDCTYPLHWGWAWPRACLWPLKYQQTCRVLLQAETWRVSECFALISYVFAMKTGNIPGGGCSLSMGPRARSVTKKWKQSISEIWAKPLRFGDCYCGTKMNLTWPIEDFLNLGKAFIIHLCTLVTLCEAFTCGLYYRLWQTVYWCTTML